MTSPNTPKTLGEPPVEELRALAQSRAFVHLNLRWQSPKGTFQTVPSQANYPTKDLIDGTFESWLSERHGGGKFWVSILDTETHLEQLVPPFYTEIRATPAHAQAHQNPGGVHPYAGYPQSIPGTPRFLGPHTPSQQTPPVDPSQFMAHRPDELAMQFNSQLQIEKRELELKYEREKEKLERKLEFEKERAAKLEGQMRDMETKHTNAIHELRLDMMAKLREAPPQQPRMDYAPLVAAIVPVFTALIESSSNRSAASLTAQQKSMELQMGSITSLMAAQSKQQPPKEDFKLFEIIMPLILKSIDERSPSKMADLVATMGENQMGILSMVSQAFRDMMPEETDDPMMKMIMKALEGVQHVAAAAMPGGAEGEEPSRGNQIIPQHHAPPQANGQQQPMTPSQIADQLVRNAPPPFQTKEWHHLFAQIHSSLPTYDVAKSIAAHLDELYEANRLPPDLQPLNENTGDPPSVVLRSALLDRLPIAQMNPQRLQEICKHFDAFYVLEDDEVSAEAQETH